MPLKISFFRLLGLRPEAYVNEFTKGLDLLSDPPYLPDLLAAEHHPQGPLPPPAMQCQCG